MFEEGKRAAYPPGVALPRRAKLVEKGRKARLGKATPFIHPLGNRRHRRAMIARGLLERSAEWRDTLRELRRVNKDEPIDEGRHLVFFKGKERILGSADATVLDGDA